MFPKEDGEAWRETEPIIAIIGQVRSSRGVFPVRVGLSLYVRGHPAYVGHARENLQVRHRSGNLGREGKW